MKKYLIIAMPQAKHTAGVQAKLDAMIQRFSRFDSPQDTCGGWVTWRVAANPTKLWDVTCLATEHLRVKALDQLDDDKVQALRDAIADAGIRIDLSDNPVADLQAAGLETIPGDTP
jgi:hypothetical protein